MSNPKCIPLCGRRFKSYWCRVFLASRGRGVGGRVLFLPFKCLRPSRSQEHRGGPLNCQRVRTGSSPASVVIFWFVRVCLPFFFSLSEGYKTRNSLKARPRRALHDVGRSQRNQNLGALSLAMPDPLLPYYSPTSSSSSCNGVLDSFIYRPPSQKRVPVCLVECSDRTSESGVWRKPPTNNE